MFPTVKRHGAAIDGPQKRAGVTWRTKVKKKERKAIEVVGLDFRDGELTHVGVFRCDRWSEMAFEEGVPWVQISASTESLPFSSLAAYDVHGKASSSAPSSEEGAVVPTPDFDSWRRISFFVESQVFGRALQRFGTADLVQVRREADRFLKALDTAYFEDPKVGLRLTLEPATTLRVLGQVGHMNALRSQTLPRSFFGDVIDLLALDGCPTCTAGRDAATRPVNETALER